MPNEFNANDIFDMAVQIEKNGALFYRDAATYMDEEQHKTFLLHLAEMEDAHEQTFLDMKNDLGKNETASSDFDPEDENILYLKALADSKVFFDKEMPDKSLKSILSCAIQTEKDSIAFYLGMKGLVSEKAGQVKIDNIIKEEMTHIRILAGKLAEYY